MSSRLRSCTATDADHCWAIRSGKSAVKSCTLTTASLPVTFACTMPGTRNEPFGKVLVAPGLESARVGGDLLDLNPGMEVDFLRHVAEPLLARGAELPSRLAQDADVAALRVLQAQSAFEQRRLAGAVLAHEAQDR